MKTLATGRLERSCSSALAPRPLGYEPALGTGPPSPVWLGHSACLAAGKLSLPFPGLVWKPAGLVAPLCTVNVHLVS
jgi:hypothetical protein